MAITKKRFLGKSFLPLQQHLPPQGLAVPGARALSLSQPAACRRAARKSLGQTRNVLNPRSWPDCPSMCWARIAHGDGVRRRGCPNHARLCQASAGPACTLAPLGHPRLDQLALELGDSRQDTDGQTTARRRGVHGRVVPNSAASAALSPTQKRSYRSPPTRCGQSGQR
jgi:hypothetical protein